MQRPKTQRNHSTEKWLNEILRVMPLSAESIEYAVCRESERDVETNVVINKQRLKV